MKKFASSTADSNSCVGSQRNAQRRVHQLAERIGENHSPEMRRGLAIAAAGGEASDAPDGVAQRQPRRERVTGCQRRHAMFADVPRRRRKAADQSPGKHSARLQRAQAENFAGMGSVGAPVIDDVKNLGADNAAQHDDNAQIPGVVTVDALLPGVADADPQPNQHAQWRPRTRRWAN